jgi:predicted DNA-binding transcriptional regulator AlpA
MDDINDRLLPWSELERIVPYSRVHVGRLERSGLFPQHIVVGVGRAARVAWLASEVREWLAEKAASRHKGQTGPPDG